MAAYPLLRDQVGSFVKEKWWEVNVMLKRASLKISLITLLTFTICTAVARVPAMAAPKRPTDRIKHVIVIYYENWAFNGLFGLFPGANGSLTSCEAATD